MLVISLRSLGSHSCTVLTPLVRLLAARPQLDRRLATPAPSSRCDGDPSPAAGRARPRWPSHRRCSAAAARRSPNGRPLCTRGGAHCGPCTGRQCWIRCSADFLRRDPGRPAAALRARGAAQGGLVCMAQTRCVRCVGKSYWQSARSLHLHARRILCRLVPPATIMRSWPAAARPTQWMWCALLGGGAWWAGLVHAPALKPCFCAVNWSGLRLLVQQ